MIATWVLCASLVFVIAPRVSNSQYYRQIPQQHPHQHGNLDFSKNNYLRKGMSQHRGMDKLQKLLEKSSRGRKLKARKKGLRRDDVDKMPGSGHFKPKAS